MNLIDFANDAMDIPIMSATRFRFDRNGLSALISNASRRRQFRTENEKLLGLIARESFEDVNKLISLVKDLGLASQLVEGMVEAGLTHSEVVSVGQRKKALKLFKRLLSDPAVFSQVQKAWGKRGKEGVWQKFFEDNTWILGYGLRYQFGSELGGQQLQQMIKGHDMRGAGKQVDALMKTRGLISSICLVEIKHHDTKLLKATRTGDSDVEHRPDVYLPSPELTGAVVQAQAYAQITLDNLENCYQPKRDGIRTGEEVFTFMPKALVICGSLSQLQVDDKVAEMKYRTFELFRRNINNPEIITFDELYERARFIVGDT